MPARKPRRCRKCKRQFAARWRRRYCSRDCEKGWMVPAQGPRPSRTAVTAQHFLLGVQLTERSEPATATHGKPRGKAGLLDGEELDVYLGGHLADEADEDEAYRRDAVLDYVLTSDQSDLLAALASD